MKKTLNKLKLKYFIILNIIIFYTSFVNANVINKININGNDRISKQTIILFSDIQLNENITNDKLNKILKNLYETNFFKNVSVKIINDELLINVEEAPIIDKLIFSGIKADRILEDLNKLVNLKSRSFYNDFLINRDRSIILNYLKNLGYYYSNITIIEEVGNNLLIADHKIDLGKKLKSKITFIGDKIFKDNKLKIL